MRRPLVYSIVLHAVVIAVVAFGLPALSPPPLLVEEPMVVDLVPLAERANPPPAMEPAAIPEAARPAAPKPAREERSEPSPQPAEPKAAARAEPPPPKPAPAKSEPRPEPSKAEAKAEAKPEAKPEKPEPKPQPSKPEPPKPEPVKAEPRPTPAKPEPPKPEPKTVARAEPEPEPKPQVKPKLPETKPEARPEQKPEKAEEKPAPPSERKPEPAKPPLPPATAHRKAEPADDFASVMKTVEELKSGKSEAKPSPPPARKAETAGDPEFASQVAQALRSTGPTGNKPSLPVTASEIDSVRRQIERCWNPPSGVKEAGDLAVSIRVEMNADGTPRSAVIDGSSRGQSNPLFQATADSARRAVLNPRCHPFKLPPEKFDRWRTMTLIFNPREMAGT